MSDYPEGTLPGMEHRIIDLERQAIELRRRLKNADVAALARRLKIERLEEEIEELIRQLGAANARLGEMRR